MIGAQVTSFAAAFGVVFLAELPDKSVFASVVLTLRDRRPFAVWTGAVSAFAVHVALAVTVGSFLRRLPDRPLEMGVGVLFLVGALLLWRNSDDEPGEVDDEVALPPVPFARVAVRAAVVLGIAEFGDLTQLLTVGLAGSTGDPVAVAGGAWLALATVTGLAVLAGRWLGRTLPMGVVRKVAAAVLAVFGVAAIAIALA